MNKNLQHIEKAMKHIKAIEPENDTDRKYIRQLTTMLHNMRMKMEAKLREEIENLPKLPDDAICTKEVKGKCKDCGHFKDINVPFCGMCSKHNKSAGNDETCDDFKLSDKEFDEIADAMEQIGKDIEKEKQLNDKEIEKLEEQFASDEYIEELRQKQQTDCSKCIYQISKLGNLPNEENNVGFIKGKRNATMGYGIKVCCQFDLRESRPICPLFDDGKEVKQ